jgi:hypothetical protein
MYRKRLAEFFRELFVFKSAPARAGACRMEDCVSSFHLILSWRWDTMKRIFLLFSMCAVLFMGAATGATFAAADINGSWAGDLTMQDGNSITFTYMFKVDGTKLTGTVQGPRGDSLSLDNGKVDGDKFSFDVNINNGVTIHNEGTVNADDTIKLSTKVNDGTFPPAELTLKRVKTDAPKPTNQN